MLHGKRTGIWGIAVLSLIAMTFGIGILLREASLMAMSSCLPEGVLMDTVAEFVPRPGTIIRAGDESAYRRVTVADRLLEIGAFVRDGKILDRGGREVRFFKGYGGGAAPPRDLIDRYRAERERLASRFTVIDLAPFDPSHMPQ